MVYQRKLNLHLGDYKSRVLEVTELGTYVHRGVERGYKHILPERHGDLNLLPQAVQMARVFFRESPQKRHRYFHHLNSSQAFALNLFLPFFGGGPVTAQCLLRAFGLGGELLDFQLECVPNSGEGTNIDAWWRTTDHATFCEVKLSERGFGKAKLDRKHLEKLETIYAPALRPFLRTESLEPAAFFKDYQFFRNIWHMICSPGSELIFLLPKANIPLWKHLETLTSALPASIHPRVHAIGIEDVLERLRASRDAVPDGLRLHMEMMREKYIVGAA